MASVCIYFQIHQPYRLRPYSVFDTQPTYFDDDRNAQLIGHVTDTCYLPATNLILELIEKFDGQFRIAFSLTGTVIEQLKQHRPEMIALLKKLAATGCVEFLGETYDHSLCCLYSRDELRSQVQLHTQLMKDLFGQTPRVYRNTELIYNNELGHFVAQLGQFDGVVVAGPEHILGDRSVNQLYRSPGTSTLPLLLKNNLLSDDIAVRFANRQWTEYPLTAEKFAGWINQNTHEGVVCNLFMAYEALGQDLAADGRALEFFAQLPAAVLREGKNDFKTPSECIEAYQPIGVYDVPHMTSWAQTESDLSAWLGNAMQSNALLELYKLEPTVKGSGDEQLLIEWRRLTASDHFYYMSTKYFSQGDAHQYFNPYESPYDAYINFMNVLDNLRTRTDQTSPTNLRAG